MDQRAIQQVLLARYYLHLAAEQVRQESSIARFAAIILYHEAFETTLIACADHLNAGVSGKSTIETYLDKINQALVSGSLPFRSRMLQFNHARVAAKHHANLPEPAFFELAKSVVPEFVKEAVRLTFGAELEELTLVELVEDGEVAGHLREATELFSKLRYHESLVAARKALYLQFESTFNIVKFSETDTSTSKGALGLLTMCEAPQYAKNKAYIDKYVQRPTDYVVLDHGKVNSMLLHDGIEPNTFWNIWRLTPKVYQFQDNSWTFDHEYEIADDPNIREHCSYVVDNLIAITLQRQNARRRIKSRDRSSRYIHVREGAQLLKKAQIGSEIAGILPAGVRRVNVDRKVTSLDGQHSFIEASYIRGVVLSDVGIWLRGWIDVRDTIGEPETGFVADGVGPGNFVPGNPDDEA